MRFLKVLAMVAANVFAAIALVLWSGFLWMGIGLIRGVADQHVSGYPTAYQIGYCIGMPAVLIALLVLAFVVFNFVRRSPIILAALAGVSMVILFFDVIGIYNGM